MVTIDSLREDEALSIVNRPFNELQGVTVKVTGNKLILFIYFFLNPISH